MNSLYQLVFNLELLRDKEEAGIGELERLGRYIGETCSTIATNVEISDLDEIPHKVDEKDLEQLHILKDGMFWIVETLKEALNGRERIDNLVVNRNRNALEVVEQQKVIVLRTIRVVFELLKIREPAEAQD